MSRILNNFQWKDEDENQETKATKIKMQMELMAAKGEAQNRLLQERAHLMVLRVGWKATESVS